MAVQNSGYVSRLGPNYSWRRSGIAMKLVLRYDYDAWILHAELPNGELLRYEVDERYMSGQNNAIKEAMAWLAKRGIQASPEDFIITGLPDGWNERRVRKRKRLAELRRRPPRRKLKDIGRN